MTVQKEGVRPRRPGPSQKTPPEPTGYLLDTTSSGLYQQGERWIAEVRSPHYAAAAGATQRAAVKQLVRYIEAQNERVRRHEETFANRVARYFAEWRLQRKPQRPGIVGQFVRIASQVPGVGEVRARQTASGISFYIVAAEPRETIVEGLEELLSVSPLGQSERFEYRVLTPDLADSIRDYRLVFVGA